MRPYVSLRGRREFTRAVRRGSVASTAALTVYVLAQRRPANEPPKVGVIVTKRVGKAVVRNRVRRRCKAILDGALAPSGGRWYVVQCKPGCANLPFSDLRRQLLEALQRAGTPRAKTP